MKDSTKGFLAWIVAFLLATAFIGGWAGLWLWMIIAIRG